MTLITTVRRRESIDIRRDVITGGVILSMLLRDDAVNQLPQGINDAALVLSADESGKLAMEMLTLLGFDVILSPVDTRLLEAEARRTGEDVPAGLPQ